MVALRFAICKTIFSPADIEKGARWSSEIARELEHSKVGIICITNQNLVAPWIMFEAGALAKSIEKSRVIPILFDVKPSELVGPLTQFQAANYNKEEILSILKTINTALGESSLEISVLESAFNKWWIDLDSKIIKIFESAEVEEHHAVRTERELIEEILDRVRFRDQNESEFNIAFLRPLLDLNLSVSTIDALNQENIYYIGDLAQKQPIELLKIPGIGKRALNEIVASLALKNINIGQRIFEWPPKSLRD